MVERLDKVFGLDITKKLQQENSVVGIPITQRTTPTITRTPMEELELAYLKDPTIFNGINKSVQTIMSAGYELQCSNKRILNKYNEFLKGIGDTGSDTTWDELLSQTFKHQMIYGTAWIETVLDKRTNTHMVDLEMIDPKRMDYAKTSNNKIALDKAGRPWGYVQTLPYTESVPANLSDPIPAGSNISRQSNQIYLAPHRIARFPLFPIGDSFYPIGLIEPAINETTWKLNAAKGLANFIYSSGYPTKIAKIGDLNNPPTPQERDRVLDILTKADYSKVIVMPYYNSIDYLEAKHPERMQENLNYFLKQQVTSLGIPLPYATGGGEATNRSTLTNQDKMFRLTLKEVIRRTSSNIEKYIFKRIAKAEGYATIPTIKWGEIEEAGMIEKSDRLIKYIQAGVLKPEEMTDYVKKIENLDIKEGG